MAIVDPFDAPAASGGIVDPFDAGAAAPADDHGLARRKKMSQAELAVSPITEYPRNYAEMRTEAQQQVGQGVEQLTSALRNAKGGLYEPGEAANLWQGAKGAGNIGLGALGYLFSPVGAAYRSVIGQPLEDVTGVPREYTEFAAQLATPGIGFTGKAPEVAAVPRGFRTEAEPPSPPAPSVSPAVQQAIEGQPRALTTESRTAQQAAQFLAKTPVGGSIGRAIEAVPGKFGEARNAVADELGDFRTPGNVASDIRTEIGGAAQTETQAAETAARQADEAAQAEYERTNQQREQAIAQQEQRSAQAANQQIGSVAPVNMGDAIIDTVQDNHRIARNAKDQAYREAADTNATVLDEANADAHGAVQQSLRSDIDGQGRVDLTAAAVPTARGMLRRIRQFSSDARTRTAQAQAEAIDGGGTVADAAQTGQSMRNIEGVRQDLNFAASGADNDADRRAAQRIIQGFDQWHENAMQHSLMDGSDPGALEAFQRARAANRDFRERFGYNDRNDADATLNKIVQPGDQIGPEDVSKALFAGGNKPTRLLDAIYQATGDHPNHANVVQAIRGGFWRKLSGTGPGETARTPENIAGGIHDFMNRRETAGRIFTPQDQALARAHANTLRDAVAARQEATTAAKANRPVPTEVTKGPMQDLADRVLGRGQKSDEALFDTIEGYAKSKGGGKDIATLAQVMRSLPEDLRGNFRNTFIRRLGTGLKGDFSPAKFADEWTTKVNPQAKAVLFGDGTHVRALDELADASKTFDEVHRRFGNPSGSGQVINFGKGLAAVAGAMAAGTLIGPMKIIAGALGGYGTAKFLASPAGAASAARFARQMQRLQASPTVTNAAAVRLSMRNMRNTALALSSASRPPNRPRQ
jgi:hypothetical protein